MGKGRDLCELTNTKFWDDRYESEKFADHEQIGDGEHLNPPIIKTYEWFRSFNTLRPFFLKHLPPSSSSILILHLGCGNSALTADLHNEGYTNQINVDFSPTLINAMRVKYASLRAQWLIMDIRDLQFDDNCVDIAVDKGTLDTFLHGSPWDPPDDVRENVRKYIDNILRVLKSGAKWLYVTYRQPHFITPLLTRSTWTLEVEILENPGGADCFAYFGFIMTKL